jgi:hypothetical protein
VFRLDREVGPYYRAGSVLSCRRGSRQPITVETPPEGAMRKITLRGTHVAYVSERFGLVVVHDLARGGFSSQGCPQALKAGATLTIDDHGNAGWRNGAHHGHC